MNAINIYFFAETETLSFAGAIDKTDHLRYVKPLRDRTQDYNGFK